MVRYSYHERLPDTPHWQGAASPMMVNNVRGNYS